MLAYSVVSVRLVVSLKVFLEGVKERVNREMGRRGRLVHMRNYGGEIVLVGECERRDVLPISLIGWLGLPLPMEQQDSTMYRWCREVSSQSNRR